MRRERVSLHQKRYNFKLYVDGNFRKEFCLCRRIGKRKDPWKGNLKCKYEDLVLAVKFLFSRFLICQSGNFIWLYLLYHPPKEVFKRKMRL